VYSLIRPSRIQVSGYSGGSGSAHCKIVGLAMLVRTQHLPPSAKVARELGLPGLGGLLVVVPPCFMMCRCELLRSSGCGHMADGFGAEQAVHGTAGLADFCGQPSLVTSPPGHGKITADRRSCQPITHRIHAHDVADQMALEATAPFDLAKAFDADLLDARQLLLTAPGWYLVRSRVRRALSG
jgi:hypothetical protein